MLFGQMLSVFLVAGQTPGEDIASGFKLGGWMPDSELLTRQVKDPTLTQDALRQSTSSFHSKYLSRCNSDKRPTPRDLCRAERSTSTLSVD